MSNAGFPPLKYIKQHSKKNKKGYEPNVKDLSIKNILNTNNKPMIISDKPIIGIIDTI